MKSNDSSPANRAGDRRRTSRVGVELWVKENCDGGFYYHRVTNLSPEGLFVEKKIPFQAGQVVTLRWELPGAGHHLQARSRVVDNYRDEQSNLVGAGFQFLGLDADARRSITYLIDQNRASKRGAAFRRSEDDADQSSAESR